MGALFFGVSTLVVLLKQGTSTADCCGRTATSTSRDTLQVSTSRGGLFRTCMIEWQDITSLKLTAKAPKKMDGWNTTFLFKNPIFRGELLVSGRVALEFVHVVCPFFDLTEPAECKSLLKTQQDFQQYLWFYQPASERHPGWFNDSNFNKQPIYCPLPLGFNHFFFLNTAVMGAKSWIQHWSWLANLSTSPAMDLDVSLVIKQLCFSHGNAFFFS